MPPVTDRQNPRLGTCLGIRTAARGGTVPFGNETPDTDLMTARDKARRGSRTVAAGCVTPTGNDAEVTLRQNPRAGPRR